MYVKQSTADKIGTLKLGTTFVIEDYYSIIYPLSIKEFKKSAAQIVKTVRSLNNFTHETKESIDTKYKAFAEEYKLFQKLETKSILAEKIDSNKSLLLYEERETSVKYEKLFNNLQMNQIEFRNIIETNSLSVDSNDFYYHLYELIIQIDFLINYTKLLNSLIDKVLNKEITLEIISEKDKNAVCEKIKRFIQYKTLNECLKFTKMDIQYDHDKRNIMFTLKIPKRNPVDFILYKIVSIPNNNSEIIKIPNKILLDSLARVYQVNGTCDRIGTFYLCNRKDVYQIVDDCLPNIFNLEETECETSTMDNDTKLEDYRMYKKVYYVRENQNKNLINHPKLNYNGLIGLVYLVIFSIIIAIICCFTCLCCCCQKLRKRLHHDTKYGILKAEKLNAKNCPAPEIFRLTGEEL